MTLIKYNLGTMAVFMSSVQMVLFCLWCLTPLSIILQLYRGVYSYL